MASWATFVLAHGCTEARGRQGQHTRGACAQKPAPFDLTVVRAAGPSPSPDPLAQRCELVTGKDSQHLQAPKDSHCRSPGVSGLMEPSIQINLKS